ncbi:MAG: hypothetical protein ACRD1T_18230 [Acidimicrobiia bacterium]
MLRFSAAGLAAIIGITLSGVFSGTPASLAHEHRAVGNYEFVVGWLNEPALAYEPNGLSLRITFFPNGVPEEESEEAEAEGQPVEGLEETLQAEIIAGGGAQTRELTLEPAFNDPGHYESVIIPTVPGDYSFRVFGDLEGQQIDESFTSGPETFSVIEEVAELQFPEELQAPSAAGSTSEGTSESSSSDDTARILGIVGIIVGVIGLGAGGLAIASRRS